MVPVTVESPLRPPPRRGSTLHLFDGHPLRGDVARKRRVPAISPADRRRSRLVGHLAPTVPSLRIVDRRSTGRDRRRQQRQPRARDARGSTTLDLHSVDGIDRPSVGGTGGARARSSPPRRDAGAATSRLAPTAFEVGRRSSPARGGGEAASFAVTLGTAGRSGWSPRDRARRT